MARVVLVLLLSRMNWINIGRKDTTAVWMRQEGISIKNHIVAMAMYFRPKQSPIKRKRIIDEN